MQATTNSWPLLLKIFNKYSSFLFFSFITVPLFYLFLFIIIVLFFFWVENVLGDNLGKLHPNVGQRMWQEAVATAHGGLLIVLARST